MGAPCFGVVFCIKNHYPRSREHFLTPSARRHTHPFGGLGFTAKGMKGRQVLIHPQEGLLQEARALQQSSDYDRYRQLRVVAEHRLARLEQLGIRQARYFGRVKTKFQLYLAATVANLTLLANQTGVVGDSGDNRDGIVTTAEIGGNLGVDHHLLPTWTLAWLRSPTLALSLCPTVAFRPAF